MGSVIRYVACVTFSVFYLSSMTQAYRLEANNTDTGVAAHTKAATIQPHWLSNSNTFWFRNQTQNETTFIYVDPNQGVRQPAFDHEGVARALKEQHVEAVATDLPFTWIDAQDNCTTVRFHAGDQNWEWRNNDTLIPFHGEVSDGDTSLTLTPLSEEQPPVKSEGETKIKFKNQMKGRVSLYWINSFGAEKHYRDVESGRTVDQHTYEGHVWRARDTATGAIIASFAAASDKTAVIKEGLRPANTLAESIVLSKRQSNDTDDQIFFIDNNVWFRDENGQETQLSTTGSAANPFSNHTYKSPDEKFVVVFQTTPGQERIVYEVESSPKDQLQPRLIQFGYPKPGDKVQIDRPRMFDLTSKREVPTDDALFRNPYKINALNGNGWNDESSEFRFVFNERGHQVMRIVGMNTQGQVRAVVEDTTKTFIDYANKLYYKEIQTSNSSEMIWASERDGWNHLYLYDTKSGKVKNQITKGEWLVRSVDYVDEVKRQIWVKVFGAVPGQDPYYAHLARVNFDGSDFKILTEGDGSHQWSFSPDRKTFTDTWSRMDMAAKIVTRDAETGKETSVVQEGNLNWLRWPVPERFAAPGRDGRTLIHGLIFRPLNMDNNTKYPVIERIYAGPQDFYTPKEYKVDSEAHQLANQGFIVVAMDGMGTNWRSKAFHDVCYKNIRDAGFPDRIAWMKAAGKTRPWMDLDHVGVFGSSAGGQNAMGALLFHNDFYSVAVADSGCHDNRMDKMWWNEAWMGYPVDESYARSSNVVNAAQLKGSLMLIVAELDMNVDPASTMQVVNALNVADKDYDLLFMPGEEHSVGGYSPYAIRRKNEFLYRKLKGKEPVK